MARISLYVPDELQVRMEAAREAINCSEVARPALTAAVAAFEHQKGKNVTTAIERLRASKQRADQEDKSRGNEFGRGWAENYAEYRWLRELLFRRNRHPFEEPKHALRCIMDPTDDRVNEDVAELLYPARQSDEAFTEIDFLIF